MALTHNINDITGEVVDASLKIHKNLGPGLLERVYEECLFYELQKRNFQIKRQHKIPVQYEDLIIGEAFRIDLLIEDAVVVELKSTDGLLPIHEAQILTYMKLSGINTGLLINFNVPLIKHGIKRFKL